MNLRKDHSHHKLDVYIMLGFARALCMASLWGCVNTHVLNTLHLRIHSILGAPVYIMYCARAVCVNMPLLCIAYMRYLIAAALNQVSL